MACVLTFRCEHIDGGIASLMPCIDGVPLAHLVADFERENGYNDPAGGYGSIIPAHYNLGPLPSYFLGQEKPFGSDRIGEIYALFCECGEAGCWPLIAHVRVEDLSVIWERFAQPFRSERDYTKFGPFKFARSEYDAAIAVAAAFYDVN